MEHRKYLRTKLVELRKEGVRAYIFYNRLVVNEKTFTDERTKSKLNITDPDTPIYGSSKRSSRTVIEKSSMNEENENCRTPSLWFQKTSF